MVIHRSADIETQEHLNGVVPLRHHANIEKAGIARRLVDGVFEVQLIRGTFARELAQLPQCNFYVAVLADAHAHRIVTVGPER